MNSKRSHEGYLMIDNRAAEALIAGVPPGMQIGNFFEAPTLTCSHCQTVLIVNPLRNRERAYCTGCDHYLCDICGAARASDGKCKPFRQLVEEAQELAVRGLDPSVLIVATR